MSNDTSRRNFLGISALGIAAGVVANETAALAADPSVTHDDPSPRNGSEIAIHVTCRGPALRLRSRRSLDANPQLRAAASQIQLEPGHKIPSHPRLRRRFY